jgi:hypothetical protein
MTAPAFFQVLTPLESIFNGKHKIDASQVEAACKPGRIVKLGSDGELETPAAGALAFGILYGLHGETYDRLKNDAKAKRTTFKPGDYVTAVQGNFIGQLEAACFEGGSLPNVGDALYVGVSGLLSTSANGTQIGKVVATDSVPNDAGSRTNVARVHFNIPAL